jgi:CDP-diacylglycerol---glycerol-3-phosphate 3-phosphatidyltransferase
VSARAATSKQRIDDAPALRPGPTRERNLEQRRVPADHKTQSPGVADPAAAVQESMTPAPEETGRSGFAGKGAEREVFWNLPNAITVGRIAMVPVMLLVPFMLSKPGSQVMAACFIFAALSDIVDGWLARRGDGELVTRMGKLLDPLADKLLVTTAFIMLLAVGRIPEWGAPMVVIIIGRELAVTGLRGMASNDGHAVGASWQGKLKALVQNFAVAALLFHYETFGLPGHELGMITLAVASLLTLWSGWVYFSDYFGSEA